MSQRMKTQADFIKFMVNANNKQRRLIVNALTSDQLTVIGEIALNVYTGVFPITKNYKSLLRSFKSYIRLLGSREVSKKTKTEVLNRHPKLIPLLFKPAVNQLSKSDRNGKRTRLITKDKI